MCDACIEDKQTKQLFSSDGAKKVLKGLEIVFSNVSGSMRTMSIESERCFFYLH